MKGDLRDQVTRKIKGKKRMKTNCIDKKTGLYWEDPQRKGSPVFELENSEVW